MPIKFILTITISIFIALSLLLHINFLIALLLLLSAVLFAITNDTILICLYFFIYLAMAGIADQFAVPIFGVNYLAFANIILIIISLFKLANYFIYQKRFRHSELFYPIFIFLFCRVIKIPFSHDRLISVRGFTRIASAFSLFFIGHFLSIKKSGSEKFIFKVLTFIFIGLSIYGLIEFFTGYNLFQRREIMAEVWKNFEIVGRFERVRTTFLTPPTYSFALIMFIPLYIGYYCVRRGSPLTYLGLSLLLGNLVLTFTRVAWVALVVELSLFFILYRSKAKVWMFISVISILGLLSSFVLARLANLDFSVDLRYRLLQIGLQVFKQHPIFGYGYEMFYELTGPIFGSKIAAHGDYIRILAETGLVGGVGYFFLLLKQLRFTQKNIKRSDFSKIAFMTIAGYVVFGITDNALAYSHIFWGLMGIYSGIIVHERLAEKAITKSNSSQ